MTKSGALRGRRLWVLLPVPLIIMLAGLVSAQTPPSEEWMAHCARNLESEELPKEVVRKYCACMADIGEETEMLTWDQMELERSYPPAHVQCHKAARR